MFKLRDPWVFKQWDHFKRHGPRDKGEHRGWWDRKPAKQAAVYPQGLRAGPGAQWEPQPRRRCWIAVMGGGTASSNSHPSRSCKCHIFWKKLPGERETPARVFFPPTPTNTLKTQNLHAQLCPTLGDSMDCSPPGSSVHGISQARILEWVAMPSSRGSSRPRELTCISCISCIGRQILYHLWHWEAPDRLSIQTSPAKTVERGISTLTLI